MPLYEYNCPKCDHHFEELVFGSDKPSCPECGSAEPKKMMSAHSVGAAGGGSDGVPAAACGMPSGGCGGGMCGLN